MKQETQFKINEAAWSLVFAAEKGEVTGYKKKNAIEFLRAITDEFGDLGAPSWKERADKLEASL